MHLVRWSRGQSNSTRGDNLQTVFDKLILGETLQTSSASDALGEKEAGGDGELVALVCRPAIDVLKEAGEGLRFERFLKIFISKKNEVWLPSGIRYRCTF